MIEHLYRYRPVEAVLDGHHELERQEIYLSTPDELNDPLEGFKDIFWSGDRIVWRNLLKHYMLCLQEIAVSAFVAGAEFDEETIENAVFCAPDSLPQAPIRMTYARLSSAFLESEAAKSFLDTVSGRSMPIRHNELTTYLRALHPFALDAMFKEFSASGILPRAPFTPSPPLLNQLRESSMKMMQGVPRLGELVDQPERASEALFTASERACAQLDLICAHNDSTPERRGIAFFTRSFPTAYVRALDNLVHRDWYVACFSTSPLNTSMWANYAGGHRGVCLKFKTPPNAAGDPTLTLNTIIGIRGSKTESQLVFQDVPHPLYKVTYAPNYPAIDFFRSLGTVRHSYMDRFWYLGDDGAFSPCRDAIHADENAWRENYWKTFVKTTLCKTPEWAHEEEHRVVIHSMFDISEKKDRMLKYRFGDLAGIVFGARTSVADKLRIMRIIEKKCAETGRADFEFAELCYSAAASKFVLVPLQLLKFAPSTNPSIAEPNAAA